MSAVVKVSVGRAGAAGDNVRYITRERATEGKQERVWTRNVPEYAEQGESYKERAANLREYARQLEEDELERPQRGGGKTRTHYRAIYSFDKDVTDEKARELVDKHLEENFPNARTVAAIHRDTDNAHVHVNIAARQTDGRKVQLDKKQYRSLDERWAKIYGREFGREIEHEHMTKKAEWRSWMREARAARERGEEPPPRPKRVARERNQVQERREMHAKQYGLNHANQTGIRDDQRRATNGEQPATTREQRAGRTARSLIRELARDEVNARSTSQQSAAERRPRRVRGADRADSNRTQERDRVGATADHRAKQTGAASTNDARQKRADDAPLYERGQRGQQADRPTQGVSKRVAGTAESNRAEDRGRDVRQHDTSGSFDRVLRIMETVTDKSDDRGRDKVASADRRNAGRESEAARAADRKQTIQPRTERPDRSADHRREPGELTTGSIAGGIISNAVTSAPKQAASKVADKIADRIESAITTPPDEQRTQAGRQRAKYLIQLVQVGLKERATGQNAQAERQQLSGTLFQMHDSERQHEKQYGGRPRPVLTKEERDYLMQHINAPVDGHTRAEIKRELAQAFIIGESRADESLERAPERQKERERDRDRGFDRSR